MIHNDLGEFHLPDEKIAHIYRLRKEGDWPPQYFVSFSPPPKNPIALINLD